MIESEEKDIVKKKRERKKKKINRGMHSLDGNAWIPVLGPGSPRFQLQAGTQVPTKIGLDGNPDFHPARFRLGTQIRIRRDISLYFGYQTGLRKYIVEPIYRRGY